MSIWYIFINIKFLKCQCIYSDEVVTSCQWREYGEGGKEGQEEGITKQHKNASGSEYLYIHYSDYIDDLFG